MGLRVVVLDPLPLFRHGAEAVLSAAGHVVDTPDDVLAWARDGRNGVVLVSLLTDADWELVGQLRHESAVVALLDGAPPAAGARAVRTGATAVLPRGATAQALLRTVEATADGQAVLPISVVTTLATGPSAPGAPLSPEQLSWLRQLSTGSTVAQLAGRAGYSEREMFRLLKTLYRELGVDGRMQAILRAQEFGWLSG
ncbi:DNA-binding response regulator [Amycolatopsis sp. DG1A-15b]|uniref:DNA-binding response regulator n=1 Tax=Amycolatopsis sp. DG1A-15b TaxID=3052846 RepID=UPI00255BDB02|nr:DNA-binding response regulator [Amycolatopsis sp. DG1A-15b]WIX84673.1 DNA-binding response regulator [Amycolatopsis sp. DG1A-15b]